MRVATGGRERAGGRSRARIIGLTIGPNQDIARDRRNMVATGGGGAYLQHTDEGTTEGTHLHAGDSHHLAGILDTEEETEAMVVDAGMTGTTGGMIAAATEAVDMEVDMEGAGMWIVIQNLLSRVCSPAEKWH